MSASALSIPKSIEAYGRYVLRTSLLSPVKSSAYPIVTAKRVTLKFGGTYGLRTEWILVHHGQKWPFRGERIALVFGLAQLDSVRCGNVECLVAPIEAHVLAATGGALSLPTLPRHAGLEIRLSYDGRMPVDNLAASAGVVFHGEVVIDGHEARWHPTAYGRRMFKYRELGEGRRV